MRESDYNKEELIDLLHKYYREFGKVPTTREIKAQEGYPTDYPFRRVFGSYKNALTAAKLFEFKDNKNHNVFDRKSRTDEELLKELENYMREKEEIPPLRVLKRELADPGFGTYERRFYSIYSALEQIGWNVESKRQLDLDALREDMLTNYKLLAKTLEKTPSSRDINKNSANGNGYSMSSYEFHFGSLYELQVASDLDPTVVGRNKTTGDMIEDLTTVYKLLGRTPLKKDLKDFTGVASDSTYVSTFGSWNQALTKAGLKTNSRSYFSKGGVLCLSTYELYFANMLEEYQIMFSTENLYKDYIKDLDDIRRFDYVIQYEGKEYFIEIFGIVGREEYDQRAQAKIDLCKQHGIPLIKFYPDDFKTHDLSVLHSILVERTKQLKTIDKQYYIV